MKSNETEMNHGKNINYYVKGISRRNPLAVASIKNLKYIFYNRKLSIAIKTRKESK